MINAKWLGLVALVLVLVTTNVASHQAKEAVTRVLFNNRTGNIEVMHRFLLHDAEHAVRKIFDGDADILRSQVVRDQFSVYVSEHFALHDGNAQVLPLADVGNEIDGRYLWVYAETRIPLKLEALSITHDALRDLWPEQSNLVTIEYNGDTASALFTDGGSSVTISLAPK
ncbi:MAG: DUF6702 family protein [Woeseiaceae bacterium]